MISVAAGVIRKNGKVLLARRKDSCPWQPGKWEFPGGKIEAGESGEECLVREIKEELGIDIAVDKHLIDVSHVYTKDGDELGVKLITYLADWVSGEVEHLDVKDSKWVDVEEILNYDLVEADKGIVRELDNLQ